MSTKLLVDTSVWINYFENDPSTTIFLDDILFTKDIYITGPIITELLAGTQGTKEKERLQYCIGAVKSLEIDQNNWIMAGRLISNLNEEGISINKTNALIASVAISNGCDIVTSNNAFKKIEEVNSYSITWIKDSFGI